MKQVFRIVPGSTGIAFTEAGLVALAGVVAYLLGNGPWWALAPGAGIPLLLAGLFGYFLYSSRRTTFEVTPESLAVRGTMYGRNISLSLIQANEVKVLDLREKGDYSPQWRTNGLGLPDYSLGWFTLKNGEKALLFLTDRSRVAYIPTSERFSLILSAREPEQLVQAVRNACTGQKPAHKQTSRERRTP